MLYNKNEEILLVIGIVSLIISLLLDLFRGQKPIIDFFSGLFTGLSITMNLGFLIRFRHERNKSINNNVEGF